MDTGSHLLFGATLAGLSQLDPSIASNPELAHAILIAAMIGSHAPDLDTVTRLRSYNHYIRLHRGLTHSIPAWFVWPALIALPTAMALDVMGSFGSLYLWTLAAVIFHVFLDWLNVYGVQCFRPVNRRWHHLDILALFDPFLFGIHSCGIVLWLASGMEAGPIFLAVYILTFLYIALRARHHQTMVRRVRDHFLAGEGICHVLPGLHWFRWQFVLETTEQFYTGEIIRGEVVLRDVYLKDRQHPAVQATLGTDGVRAFLHFAQRVYVKITESRDGYEVQWRDVRFWYNRKLPFGVDVKLDRDLKVEREYLGWSKKSWQPPYV